VEECAAALAAGDLEAAGAHMTYSHLSLQDDFEVWAVCGGSLRAPGLSSLRHPACNFESTAAQRPRAAVAVRLKPLRAPLLRLFPSRAFFSCFYTPA